MQCKVLYILNSLNCGGEENFVMNLYRNIDRSKVKIVFCIPDIDGSRQYFEDEIMGNGDVIYKVPSKSRRPLQNYLSIKKIVRDERISCVHYHSDNSMMALGLFAAGKGGAGKLIAHSHSSNINGGCMRLLHFIFRVLLNHIADEKLACSTEAGKWMYGKAKFTLINNGIDLKKYVFDPKIRKKIRNQYCLDEKYVLGHVGRFAEVKNQEFLLEVLKDLSEVSSQETVLLLLGDGELKEKLRRKAAELGVEKSVLFMGNRSDVNVFLQAMDCFLFPSLYEGLPLSLVEAQAAGLPCIVSENVSRESKITSLVRFQSIDRGTDEWVKLILETMQDGGDRMLSEADRAGLKRFDVNEVVDYLMRLYKEGMT